MRISFPLQTQFFFELRTPECRDYLMIDTVSMRIPKIPLTYSFVLLGDCPSLVSLVPFTATNIFLNLLLLSFCSLRRDGDAVD